VLLCVVGPLADVSTWPKKHIATRCLVAVWIGTSLLSLRQGIGALLAGADMLNPVSAYREYLKDVREGDVVGGVTNAAGFVAPGVASAVASRLARPAVSAVAPYGEDAARVLMEVLSPTGAPDISSCWPQRWSRWTCLAVSFWLG
jgi:hypothetical protein